MITLNVVKDIMKYDKTLLTAKAGSTIQIILQNPDFMQHNLLIIKPNTLDKVGAAADRLAQDPNGAKMNYVPKMPEVLQATPLVNPAGKFTMIFKVTQYSRRLSLCLYVSRTLENDERNFEGEEIMDQVNLNTSLQ